MLKEMHHAWRTKRLLTERTTLSLDEVTLELDPIKTLIDRLIESHL